MDFTVVDRRDLVGWTLLDVNQFRRSEILRRSSRRDRMMVAWQFIARNRVSNGPVPLGYGTILCRELIKRIIQTPKTDRIIPSLSWTDSILAPVPGNELPGYDH